MFGPLGPSETGCETHGMTDVAVLVDHFIGGGSGTGSGEQLTVDPDQAARNAAARLGAGIDEEKARVVAATMAALIRVATVEMTSRRRQASERVADSLRSMNHIHQLALALNGLIFMMGSV